MAIDSQFTQEALQSLVRIDSRNPGLESGAPGEAAIAQYVHTSLARLGWAPEFQSVCDGRANVLARWPGSGHGRSLMINVHLDTVGTQGMTDPLGGELRDGRVYGRGAQDIKGGVAAALALAKAVGEADLAFAGDLLLAFVVDEEHESLGTVRLLEDVRTDAAIVLEPSELDVCIAHRGFGVFRIDTHGRTAHGGESKLGIDANMHMGRVLAALGDLKRDWEERARHVLLGSATLHVPLVEGGRQLYMYADSCSAHVECRVVPGQSAEQVLTELQALIASLTDSVAGFSGSVRQVLWRDPYEIDPERQVVQSVLEAAAATRGEQAQLIGHAWWEDSGLLGAAGIETVVLGPTGGGLHTEREWVEVASVVHLAQILYRTVNSYCMAGVDAGGTPARGAP